MFFVDIVHAALNRAFKAQGVVLVDPSTGGAMRPASRRSYRVTVPIVRPNNVDPYAVGDVVGGLQYFDPLGPAGGAVMLATSDLAVHLAALPAGMSSFQLQFYSAAPPSAFADNAAWSLPAGDRDMHIGALDLGIPAALGATLKTGQSNAIAHHVVFPAGSSRLYFYLRTTAAYTPTALETYAVSMSSVEVV